MYATINKLIISVLIKCLMPENCLLIQIRHFYSAKKSFEKLHGIILRI